MWRQAVGHIYVDERSQYAIIRPYGNLCGIGKIGVRLSEGEQEAKAIEAGGELIYQIGREGVPITDR